MTLNPIPPLDPSPPASMPEPVPPCIVWSPRAGRVGEFIGDVTLNANAPDFQTHPLRGATLLLQPAAGMNHGRRFRVEVVTGSGRAKRSLPFLWDGDAFPTFPFVEALALAWQYGREIGNEEGRDAVTTAIAETLKNWAPWVKEIVRKFSA